MLLTIVVNLLLRLRGVNDSAGTAGDCLTPAYADGSPAAGLPTPAVARRVSYMPDSLFRDRRDAGRALAGLLGRYRNRGDVVVLALPRGGVPVGYEVATALRAPLDVFLVRKLGLPGSEELAMGAIPSGGVVVINDDVVGGLGIRPETVQSFAEREGRELPGGSISTARADPRLSWPAKS